MNRPGRTLGLLVAVVAAISILPAGAAPSARTAKAEYQGPGEIEVGTAVVLFGPVRVMEDQVAGAVRFETRANERSVNLEIVDDTGQSIKGHVEQRIGGDYRLLGHFCGATERPFRIKPGKPLLVYPGSAPCGGSAVGATWGVVVARFTP